jgi:intergrase/recombinase
MLSKVKEMMRVLPSAMADIIRFAVLTELRSTESCESVRMLNEGRKVYLSTYYNSEQQILQHYRFPDLFIRRTKAVYISVVNDEIIGIAKKIDKTPSLIGLKKAIMRRHLSMRLKYCRKIYASYLHRCGVSSDLINILQGKIGKNIFLRHYLVPSNNYKDQVLQSLSQLMNHVQN